MTPEQQTFERGMQALGWKRGTVSWYEIFRPGRRRSWFLGDPALPPYLASQLREEVVRRGIPYTPIVMIALIDSMESIDGSFKSFDYDLINAACDVLEEET